MARQGRLHVPYATYFVVDRFPTGVDTLVGAPGRAHTDDELQQIAANREQYEKQLTYAMRRWRARVHAHCWLPESALLLVQIAQVPLECVMHSLRCPFSRYLRKQNGKQNGSNGHTLNGHSHSRSHDGRYHALLLDPDEFLLDFARHLFWRPVTAGLCKTPLGYEHNGARTYLGEPTPVFLEQSGIPEALAQRGLSSRAGFTKFLAAPPTPGFPALLARGSRKDRRIAGGTLFVREVRRKAERLHLAASRDAILEWVANDLGVEPLAILTSPRHRKQVMARAFLAWLTTSSGAETLSEVARWFECGKSTLHHGIGHYLKARPDLFNDETLERFIEFLESVDSVEATTKSDFVLAR